MSRISQDRTHAVPAELSAALDACARGELPPNVALMRLLGGAPYEEEAERALAAALAALEAAGRRRQAERLRRLDALWRASPGAWSLVRSVLGEADHTLLAASEEEAVGRWAAIFDRLAERVPEAAVALYSLGRSDLLDASTAELAGLLRGWGLLDGRPDVLDLGCGIGRLTAALAAEAGSVVGIDVSPGMIAAARRRCAGLGNVRLRTTDGRDLSAFADAVFHLVLAVDVFPYLVQAGMETAARHVAEAARVLRPGGALVIFNFSYRGDLACDRSDLARLALSSGLAMVRAGTQDVRLWDAAAFQLTKPVRRSKIEGQQPPP